MWWEGWECSGDKAVIMSENPACFGVPRSSRRPKGAEEPIQWCSHKVPSQGSLWLLHICTLLAFFIGQSTIMCKTPESGILHF